MIIKRNDHRIGHHDPEHKINILRNDPSSKKQPVGEKELPPVQIVPAESLYSEASQILLPSALKRYFPLFAIDFMK